VEKAGRGYRALEDGNVVFVGVVLEEIRYSVLTEMGAQEVW